MLPTIPSGNVTSGLATGYEVANSCRFNDDDSAELTLTPTAGNQKTWTFSFWTKRSAISGSTTYSILEAGHGSTPWFIAAFNNDEIHIAATAGSSASWETTAVFRDPSAWYHIVLVLDTTSSTSSISNGSTDRIRVYVNGVQQTIAGGTVPSLNADLQWNSNVGHHLFGASYGQYFDGYVAEVFFIDGSALAPTAFGEFDEDSPTIWKPKDCKDDLTFGSEGYYLDFADSGDLGDDESGNGNDWTEANLAATDQATDTPTNNFATWNPLDNYFAASTFSEGNLALTSGSSNETYNTSTFGLTAGKWYAELKHNGGSATPYRQLFGITQNPTDATGQYLGSDNDDSWGYYDNDGKVYHNNSDSVASYDTWTANDIIGLALDLDNNRLYFAKNGTWQGSSDPTDGTNAISIDANYTYFIAWGDATSNTNNSIVNFGNPPYANSSDAADANGYGAFEYAPPSGYLALCTKNLGSDGG